MGCYALIVAAGRGQRLGGAVAKPYRLLGGRPLLLWSLDLFEASPLCDGIVVVVAPDRLELASALLASRGPGKLRGICAGGAERSDSVAAGLKLLPEDTRLVAVHDAARPLLSLALLERLITAATEAGAAIPVLPLADTLRSGESGASRGCLDRRGLYLTQTPQVFRGELLRAAHAAAVTASRTTPVTDDAQLVEELGHPVRLVEGDPQNFKITSPGDLELAAGLAGAAEAAAPRTGIGYDVHRLVAGRKLWLGGVELEHPTGLLGHSDADVLCHAAGDALLGAAALGDLGSHFPPSDPRWQDARSLELLALIVEQVVRAGFRVGNLDAMLICEAPPIAPHAGRMRENLARALRVTPDRISVKATSNEGLGWLGRGEGIACLSTALLLPAANPARTALS